MENFFGERLKRLRDDNKKTQQDVANYLGVNVMTIVKWEKGLFEPSITNIRKVSKLFEVSVPYLIGEDNCTLLLIVVAEMFSKINKLSPLNKTPYLEYTKWVNLLFDILQSYEGIKPLSILPPQEVLDVLKKYGYTKEVHDIVLTYPDDYNKKIINSIVKLEIMNDDVYDFDIPPALNEKLSLLPQYDTNLYNGLFDIIN